MKQKLLMLFIVSLFFLSIFPSNFSSTVVEENFYDIDPLRGYPSKLGTTIDNVSTEINCPKLSINDWVQGQSVKTVYEFPSSLFPLESDRRSFLLPYDDWSASEYYPERAISSVNDSKYYRFNSTGTTSITYQDINDFTHEGGPGIALRFYAAQQGKFFYYSRSAAKNSSNLWEYSNWVQDNGNLFISSKYIDREGYVNIYISTLILKIVTAYNFFALSYLIDPTDGSADLLADFGGFNLGETSTNGSMIDIDFAYYQQDSIESHIRSERLNIDANTYQNRLSFEVPTFGTNITISPSDNWDFSGITPENPYNQNGGDIEFYGLPPIIHQVDFTETSSKQYLAIDDKSSDYLSDIGFEGYWQNDWDISHAQGYDSVTLNSTVVYSGAFSIGIVEADIGQIRLTPLPDGYYYLKVSGYSVSGTTSLRVYSYDSSWSYETVTLNQNRWTNFFLFIKIGGIESEGQSYETNFQFYTPSAVTYFLDGFEIWKVNHEISTESWRKIKVSGQMISWDGYQNPAVPNEDIELELRDRTADSSIVSDSTKSTDINGNFEWEIDTSSHSELQDQREIEIRSWSWDSWFGSEFNYDKTEEQDLDDWRLSGWADSSESFSTDSIWGEYSYQAEGSGGTGNQGMYFDPSSDFDVYSSDLLVFYLKSNITIGSDGDWYIMSTPEYNGETQWGETLSANIWTRFAFFYEEDQYHLNGVLENSIDILRFDTDLSTAIKLNWEWKIIQTQKSYFTPQYPTDWDFAQSDSDLTWGTDGWDFQEEIADGWVEGTGFNDDYDSGFYSVTVDATGTLSFFITSLDIDTTHYDYLQLRIKCNTTGTSAGVRVHNLPDYEQVGDMTTVSSSYSVLSWDLSTDSDWDSNVIGWRFYFTEIDITLLQVNDTIWVDWVRLCHRDTPSILTADSYAWVTSSNNSFVYRTEIDDTVQGYYEDLVYFSTDQSVASHTINATVYNDLDRSNIVFLPGTSVTSSYTVSTDFYVSVENIYASDEYMNIFVTASKSGSYIIYENDSNVGSGNFDKDGTSISHSKDTTYGVFIELAYEFVNSTDIVWFNTSYDITDYTHLIVYISTPILVDGRISISVTSNLGNSHVKLDDDSKTGIEVNYENEGVFSWYSHIAGENNITIDVRNDANSDGDYLDTGETFSDTVSYHLYDDDLIVYFSYLLPYTDEGTTYIFASNYRGTGLAEFRCRTQDQLGWSQWLSEDTYNGSYDFTFVNCDLDTTYNFSAEIRVYITDESSGYQYYYDRFEYTPYSPDPIVQNPQGVNLPEESEEIISEGFVQITAPNKAEFFITVFILFIVMMLIVVGTSAGVIAGMYVYFENRKEDESPIDFSTRVIEEQTLKASDKVIEMTLGTIGMSSKKDQE